ncbi:MAG: acyl-CoA dehydrogenase [Thermoleophilaceae bacterium]|jgi:alkylation response protein AidB-like acyl-CoA dehydrogenase|nr:acyl-CoA dehydrogenase [Thermoleophilaceae bacterium]
MTLAEKGLPPAAARQPIPPFTDEHEQLREAIRRFVATELRPHVTEWEDAEWFPNEVFARMAELGYLGLKYPEQYGGQGGDHVHDAVLTEELTGAGSGGLSAGIGAHIGIATPPIWKFGTEDQKQRFLVPAIRGERIAALGITEPGAGSDVAGIRTFARKVDGGYVVNGSKTFITNGVRADFVVTAVKTTEDGGHQGLSFLVIEKGMEGYSVSKKLEKLGWRASDTAELAFDDLFVPDENLLGEENKGFYLIMANFQWERLVMALGAVGSMGRMIERSVTYAGERTAFGRPIGKHQAIRHKIAEMAIKHEAARSLTYHALRLFAAGQDALREVTEAKLISQRAAYEVADDALQIHGGAGYMKEYEIERAVRDTRLGPIGGGTDEVMKEILGKQLGL